MDDLVQRLKHSPLWSPHKELLEEAAAEIERLRAGGCARNQRLTQHCAEAATLRAELDFCRSRLAIHERFKGGAS